MYHMDPEPHIIAALVLVVTQHRHLELPFRYSQTVIKFLSLIPLLCFRRRGVLPLQVWVEPALFWTMKAEEGRKRTQTYVYLLHYARVPLQLRTYALLGRKHGRLPV